MNPLQVVNHSTRPPVALRNWRINETPTLDLKCAADELLMAATVQGNYAAFGLLVERYQSDLFRYCMSFLKNPERARDAAQDAFLKAFHKAPSFDAERRFKPWFFRIARNVCLNMLERDRVVEMTSLYDPAYNAYGEDGGIWESDGPDPASLALEDERHRQLMKAMRRLPERDREIVQLRYFQDMSARDIAAIVGSTEGAVRTKLHRTLKMLRDDLNSYME